MREHSAKRKSDMRFVIHCTLLLLAFVGFVTVIDHCSGQGGDVDLAGLGARQLDASDDAFVALGKARAEHCQFDRCWQPLCSWRRDLWSGNPGGA